MRDVATELQQVVIAGMLGICLVISTVVASFGAQEVADILTQEDCITTISQLSSGRDAQNNGAYESTTKVECN